MGKVARRRGVALRSTAARRRGLLMSNILDIVVEFIGCTISFGSGKTAEAARLALRFCHLQANTNLDI